MSDVSRVGFESASQSATPPADKKCRCQPLFCRLSLPSSRQEPKPDAAVAAKQGSQAPQRRYRPACRPPMPPRSRHPRRRHLHQCHLRHCQCPRRRHHHRPRLPHLQPSLRPLNVRERRQSDVVKWICYGARETMATCSCLLFPARLPHQPLLNRHPRPPCHHQPLHHRSRPLCRL
jgi:hypothetical protein